MGWAASDAHLHVAEGHYESEIVQVAERHLAKGSCCKDLAALSLPHIVKVVARNN